jgi:hypothetical protein
MSVVLFLPLLALHRLPAMSLITPQRLLVATLIVGLGTAYKVCPILLQQVKDAAKLPAPDPPPPAKNLQKDSEDALKVETLRTLADGYSYDLRKSAIKIVASRTARSKAKDLLLRDLAGRDRRRRDDAINAMKLIFANADALGPSIANEFRNPKAVAAIVKGLIHVLRERKQRPSEDESEHTSPAQNETKKRLPPSPLRPAHRPPQELALMKLLSHVFKNHPLRRDTLIVEAALQAGLVKKWLANYPFPCALPENSGFNYKRSDVVRLFDRMGWMGDDLAMADIVLVVNQFPQGRKEMRQVGLGASSIREKFYVDLGERHPWNWAWRENNTDAGSDDDRDSDVRMVNGEGTAGLLPDPESMQLWDEPAGPTMTIASARLRSAERSPEEETLRRRHREAVVLAEPGAPLTRGNIIQRVDSSTLPQPMNGVIDVAGDSDELSSTTSEDQNESEQDVSHGSSANSVHHAQETLTTVDEPGAEGQARTSVSHIFEAAESNRAHRRHRELEQLIEEDAEIQGRS